MADSKHQQIIDAIIATMQGITTAAGYETNLGDNVDDWKVNWDDEEMPALSVCDITEDQQLVGDQPDARNQINLLNVQFRIFVKNGTRARALRKMKADVNKAIGSNTRWNKLAMWTKPKRSGMVIPDESFEIGGKAIEIQIAYMTGAFNAS